jgi:4-amino-4-deoxy-L-arabinose transferase-like glycosyltransferase
VTASAHQAPDQHASTAAPTRDVLPDVAAERSNPSRGRVAGLAARIAYGARHAPFERRFLWVLLILFAAKGVIFTYAFPPFSGHDEVAHYGYMNVLMEERRLPIIPDPIAYNDAYVAGENPEFDMIPDYFQRYQRYTTPDWWGDENRVVRTVTYLGNYLPAGWVYVANHPPLYYLLMAPVWQLTDGQSPEFQLYAFRLAAIPFGLLTVLFAYLTVRRLFPRDAFLAVTVPTFVAFQPQVSYEAAMLNNDILAIATTSACLYLIVVGLQNRFTVGLTAWLGLALGLAMLSKTTAVIVMPVIAIAIVLRLGWKNIVEWLPKGGLAVALTALLAAPWYLYMLITYGSVSALDRIHTLQWWNNQDGITRSITDQLTDGWFAWMRWRETWGEFGWRLIPLSDSLLRVLLGITLLAIFGLAVWAVLVALLRWRARSATFPQLRAMVAATDPIVAAPRWQLTGVLAMVVTCIVAYYAVLQFGKTFDLTQARYYFPAVNAAAILIMLGLRMLTPVRWLPYMQTAIFIGLFLLNVVILSSYVFPYWQAVSA